MSRFVEDVNTRKRFSFSLCVFDCKNQLLKKIVAFVKSEELEYEQRSLEQREFAGVID